MLKAVGERETVELPWHQAHCCCYRTAAGFVTALSCYVHGGSIEQVHRFYFIFVCLFRGQRDVLSPAPVFTQSLGHLSFLSSLLLIHALDAQKQTPTWHSYGQTTTTEDLKTCVYNNPIAVEGTTADIKNFRRLSTGEPGTGTPRRLWPTVFRRLNPSFLLYGLVVDMVSFTKVSPHRTNAVHMR